MPLQPWSHSLPITLQSKSWILETAWERHRKPQVSKREAVRPAPYIPQVIIDRMQSVKSSCPRSSRLRLRTQTQANLLTTRNLKRNYNHHHYNKILVAVITSFQSRQGSQIVAHGRHRSQLRKLILWIRASLWIKITQVHTKLQAGNSTQQWLQITMLLAGQPRCRCKAC